MRRIEVRCPNTMRLYGTMIDEHPTARTIQYYVGHTLNTLAIAMTASIDIGVKTVVLKRGAVAGTYGPSVDALFMDSGKPSHLRRLPKFRAA